MHKRMNEALIEIYENLTDEQKEKAKACKTMDELNAFAGKEGIELPDEVLDAVAGGEPIFSEIECDEFKPCDDWC